MENSDQTLSNGKLMDPGLQIIRHPSYQSCSRLSLPWFDIRVFYVRISNFVVDDSTPECLTVTHIPLSADTLLEANGVRCSICSEGISCLLRRDRVDKKSEEATFVSTDGIRLTGSVKFEVFDRENPVLSGILEMSNKTGFSGESKHTSRRWSMDCESVMSACTAFLKVKQIVGSESLSPTIEVYVAGCFSGTPIILTKTLQLTFLKKHNRKGMLDAIPEYELAETQRDSPSGLDQQQKVLIRVTMSDSKKSRTKAMKIAATVSGVESVAIKGDNKDQIEVIGEIDTVGLAKLLRKNVGHADLLSVGPAKEEKNEGGEPAENTKEPPVVPLVWGSIPCAYSYPVYEVRDSHDPGCSIL